MPNFDVSTITKAGARLLARATENTKLLFIGCEANTTVYTQESAEDVDLIGGTRITYDISFTGIDEDSIYVRANFEPSATTGGTANSLILFGCLSTDLQGTRIPICVVSNSIPFELPMHNQAAVTSFECLFTIKFAIQSPLAIEQTSALECSLAEFRQLEKRAVTTDGLNMDGTGEAQTIYGEKTFASPMTAVEISAHNVLPAMGNTYSIGSLDAKWACVYSENTIAESAEFFEINVGEGGASIAGMITVNSRSSFKAGASFAYGITANGASLFDGNFRVSSNGYDFINISDTSTIIGSSSQWIGIGYFYKIYAGSIVSDTLRTDIKNNVGINGTLEANGIYSQDSITTDRSISANGDITANGNITANGELSVSGDASLSKITITNNGPLILGNYNSNNVYLKQYNGGVDVYGSLSPGAKNTYSLGSSSYKWKDLYINSMYGALDAVIDLIKTCLTPTTSTSSGSSIPIGGISMVRIQRYIYSGTNYDAALYYPGNTLASNTFNMRCCGVSFRSTTVDTIPSSDITSGTYKLLTAGGFSSVSSSSTAFFQYSHILVVRIA